MAWDVAESPREALDWFRSRVPLTREEFDALDVRAQARAFTVSGVADLDIVSDVWRAVDSAVEQGTTLDEFRKTVGETLEDAWGGENPWRLETIFRTNVQQAYNAGRYAQAQTADAKASHPYYRFDAVLDTRTTDICSALDGTVLPKDDSFWATHQPALHFNCRSHLTELTLQDAQYEGIDETPPDSPPVSGGFGLPPDVGPELDLSTRPPELAHLYELKQVQEAQE